MWDPATIDPRILWWYLWDHDQVPGHTCVATAGEKIWMRAIQVTHYLLTLLSCDMALLTSDSLSKIYRYLDLGDVEPMEPEAVFWRDERVVRLASVGGEVWEAELASFGLTLVSGKLNGDFRLPFPEVDLTLRESITRADSDMPWALSFLSSASQLPPSTPDVVSTPS